MRSWLLGVIVLGTLAGCGASGSGEDRDPDRRTSDEFVRRVDALCKDTNPELAKINTALITARDARRAGRVSAPTTFAVFATFLRRASRTTEAFVTRLRAIEAPKPERAFHTDLLAAVEEGLTNVRQQVSAAEAQDANRLRDLSVQGSVLNARSKGLSAGHGGFRSCGRG